MRDITKDLEERLALLDDQVNRARILLVNSELRRTTVLEMIDVEKAMQREQAIRTEATGGKSGVKPDAPAKTTAAPEGAPGAETEVTIPTAGEPLSDEMEQLKRQPSGPIQLIDDELQNLPVTAPTTVEAGDSGASPGKAREPQPATAVDGGRLGLSPVSDDVAEIVAPAIADLVAPKPSKLPPNIKIEPKTAIPHKDLKDKAADISAIAQALVKAPVVTLPKKPAADHRRPPPRPAARVMVPVVTRPPVGPVHEFDCRGVAVRVPGIKHKRLAEKFLSCIGRGILPYDVLLTAAGMGTGGSTAYLMTIVSDLRAIVKPHGLEIIAQEKMGYAMREASK